MMKSTLLAFVTALLALTLSACGGGGGGSTATTPVTPATQAPVASTGPATTAGAVSTELAGNVSISGFRSVSIAATTTSSVKTASLFSRFKSMLASAFIKPAFAQSTSTCQTDAYKLVGVGSDGSLTPLTITQGADACNVGFREMFDVGSYVLLTGEGIYKNDLTCNLVFLQKSTGNLFCVGESLSSRYQITSGGSSGTSTATMSGGMQNPVAEKIQTIYDGNGGAKYVLINAQSTSFDSNNQISGLKTKLIRFDLTDATAGPVASVILEGYQSGWSQYTTASEFEYFNLENYRLATNGDTLVSYYRSIWSNGGGLGSMGSYRRNLKYFYDFAADGSTFSTANLRDTEALALINNALSGQVVNNTGATMAAGATASAMNLGWLNISCMFDAPSNSGGVLITTPSSSWVSGYDSVNNAWYSNWSQSSSIFRVSRPDSNSAGKPVIAYVKPSLLCSDTGSMSGNTPQKIGDTWYTMQSAYTYSWGYNTNTNQYQSYYGQKTSVIGNSLATTTNNANDDVVFTVPSQSQDVAGGYYWSGSMGNTKIRASKDFMYMLNQGSTYASTNSSGMEVSRFKPSEQVSGAVISRLTSVLPSSRNISITSFTTTNKDNVVDLVGRDLASDDLDKIYGTISEDGVYTQKVITNSKYSTIAVVKL